MNIVRCTIENFNCVFLQTIKVEVIWFLHGTLRICYLNINFRTSSLWAQLAPPGKNKRLEQQCQLWAFWWWPMNRACERSVSGEKDAPRSNLFLSSRLRSRSATSRFALRFVPFLQRPLTAPLHPIFVSLRSALRSDDKVKIQN